MTWPWRRPRPHIPEIDADESKAMLAQARHRRQLTEHVVRKVSRELVKNNFGPAAAAALKEGPRR